MLRDSLKWTMPPLVIQTVARKLVTALVVVAMPAMLCAQLDADDANAVMQALQQNLNAQAAAIAGRILITHPSDCQVLTLRGIALSREGQMSDAQESFDRALHSCPESLPALEGAAQVAYFTRSPAAPDLLHRILLQRPDNQTSRAMLGSLSFQHGDCPAAIDHFEHSLALVQKSTEAQRELGACLWAQGEHQKAEEAFRRIAEQDPKDKNLLQLAFVQWKSKEFDAALTTLQPLLTSRAAGGKPFALAAQIAEDKGDTPHAVEWLRTAIIKDPANTANYLLFATLSFNHASYQVGIDMVDSGIQQSPDAAKLYLARGVLQVQLSHYAPALADFQKAHALDPQLSFVQDAMGMIRSQQHDWAGSLQIFQQQAAEHPQDPLLQYLYAEALATREGDGARQNLTKAIAAVKKALQIEPDYQPARDLLCTLLLKTNQFNEVIDQAVIALKQDPSDQSALYQEIQAQHRLGNKEAISPLVKRLQELKSQQQVAQAQYQLQDANTSRSSP
jgi:tetratricopeptide (TPR) repeat protein